MWNPDLRILLLAVTLYYTPGVNYVSGKIGTRNIIDHNGNDDTDYNDDDDDHHHHHYMTRYYHILS